MVLSKQRSILVRRQADCETQNRNYLLLYQPTRVAIIVYENTWQLQSIILFDDLFKCDAPSCPSFPWRQPNVRAILISQTPQKPLHFPYHEKKTDLNAATLPNCVPEGVCRYFFVQSVVLDSSCVCGVPTFFRHILLIHWWSKYFAHVYLTFYNNKNIVANWQHTCSSIQICD